MCDWFGIQAGFLLLRFTSFSLFVIEEPTRIMDMLFLEFEKYYINHA